MYLKVIISQGGRMRLPLNWLQIIFIFNITTDPSLHKKKVFLFLRDGEWSVSPFSLIVFKKVPLQAGLEPRGE